MKGTIGLHLFMLIGLTIAMTCTACSANASLSPIEAGYIGKGSAYTAMISPEGALGSISVNGAEFINSANDYNRGAYFHQDDVIPMKIVKVEDNTLAAESDKCAISYKFNDSNIEITTTNKTQKYMSFFIIVNSSVKAVSGKDNNIIPTPITNDWKEASFYKDSSKISISGGTKFWGPWSAGGHQVFDLGLAGGETKNVVITFSSAEPDEINAVRNISMPKIEKDADITVLSPKPWQVFQRKSRYEGEIFLSGRIALDFDKLMVRISGKSLKGRLPGKWINVNSETTTNSFSSSIPVTPGGWYRVDLRAFKGNKIIASATVENVGVGEVFVGAGQSNSTNCGQEPIKQTSGMVSSFGGEFWRIADDPQPGPKDRTGGGSYYPAFGDALYAKYRVPIGVAVTGYGGTSVTQWQPEDPMGLFPWMMTRIYKLGPNGFRAVLWHQGEADALTPTEEYVAKMTNVIRKSTELANWQFPWFVAHASYHNMQNPEWPLVRAAQSELWEKKIAMQGPDTDTLREEYRDFDGAGIHFSPKGLRAHGEMWADIISKYLDEVLD